MGVGGCNNASVVFSVLLYFCSGIIWFIVPSQQVRKKMGNGLIICFTALKKVLKLNLYSSSFVVYTEYVFLL